jgi:fluoride exporter
MTKYLVVLAGGGVGALLRFLAGTLVLKFFAGVFPLGTFLINVTGSFLIGILMTFFLRHSTIDPNWRLFLVSGILGGYTTFSSFEWETLFTLREGAAFTAMSYFLLSVVLGFAAVWLGAALAGGLRRS